MKYFQHFPKFPGCGLWKYGAGLGPPGLEQQYADHPDVRLLGSGVQQSVDHSGGHLMDCGVQQSVDHFGVHLVGSCVQ